jgi:hypothetical protein
MSAVTASCGTRARSSACILRCAGSSRAPIWRTTGNTSGDLPLMHAAAAASCRHRFAGAVSDRVRH